jgi:Amt family ammonium transporter
MNKLLIAFALTLFALAFGESAFAQTASARRFRTAPPLPRRRPRPPAAVAAAAASAAASRPCANKGDVAWMLVAPALVIMMSIPAWRCSTAAWSAARTCCRC